MFGMMRRYDADCGNDALHEDQTTKRNYLSEEQIIGILNEHEADVSVADLPQAWRQRRQALQMKSEARRDGGVGGQAAEDAGGREHAAETVAGRRHLDNAALKDLVGKKW